MRSEALKGHLDLLLLSTLDQGPAHGYGLVEALRGKSEGAFDLGEGTMYPALYRLERQGLVASRWEVVGGRRRRVYRLTRSGRGALVRQLADWRAFSSAMEAVVA
jgi:PadR family transcriptional regulator, regulatory protein PadR